MSNSDRSGSPVHRLRRPGAATAHWVLSERDCATLDFLWRWKVGTTATLHAAIGGNRSPYATYQALIRLERMKFIQSVQDLRSRYSYWELTKKGFQTIRESLKDLKEKGFKSENPWHDLNVVAFHLGDWAYFPDVPVWFCTEQELRRYSQDNYPEWVPNAGDHRGDGYTRIVHPHARSWLLSYEVELTAKSISRYESIIRIYRMVHQCDLVYWLVGSDEVKSQILKAKELVRDPKDNFHLFVDHAEYMKSGWKSIVRNSQGEPLFTIEENLWGLLGDKPRTCQSISQEKVSPLPYYDPRKALRMKENAELISSSIL
jgi:hypothetical protein